MGLFWCGTAVLSCEIEGSAYKVVNKLARWKDTTILRYCGQLVKKCQAFSRSHLIITCHFCNSSQSLLMKTSEIAVGILKACDSVYTKLFIE